VCTKTKERGESKKHVVSLSVSAHTAALHGQSLWREAAIYRPLAFYTIDYLPTKGNLIAWNGTVTYRTGVPLVANMSRSAIVALIAIEK
jgi:hypothetical protein